MEYSVADARFLYPKSKEFLFLLLLLLFYFFGSSSLLLLFGEDFGQLF
jgi:hypothetical protein